MGRRNVFVIGLDESNLRTLEAVPGAKDLDFRGLLTIEDIQVGEIPIAELLERAAAELDAFEGEIDAVIGYWDFPVTAMVPLLCRRFGLPSAPLEAVVKCEHKYWSRLEQQKVITGLPKFALVDLDDAGPPAGLDYPMWLKPVKSFSSELAFHVSDHREFTDALAEIRAGVSRVGKPFEFVLEQLDLPPEIADAGGQACLAEEAMSGQQAATEGYVYQGEVTVYGALDSLNYPGTASFLRHQYPSQLPGPLVERMFDMSERVIKQVGLDNSTFSIEFFCDTGNDDVRLLEINARHSQSHADLFLAVDGVTNHHCMVRLGLGEDPKLVKGDGDAAIAAKCYYRRFSDAVVRRVPTAEEIDELRRELPGVTVDVVPEEGQRLSDMPAQDSYSYELADVFVRAGSQAELEELYQRAVESLRFEFEED
ncbi:ATP-grasp domain-containing protein [Amycolatopsis suaedae]|uniref:ATP-grasp domain-containing protein n=1 Tax=Amycolatopsis suaedae TaxID=2510978 RepID=A0A4Q7J0H0_9PSEU|nr:ATP-grasp domain-containing protein [Amycolatopsis suaedae]RZQ60218.1 ATP-grasp domain-containing protein [Amycolatopsis suaedae]